MSNDFISLFYRQNLISSAFEIQISVCKRGTSAIVLKAQHTMAISLLKFVGLFAGSAISITKIRLRYVVPRPSCTFTLQSLRKWSFQLVRYIIARYYASSILTGQVYKCSTPPRNKKYMFPIPGNGRQTSVRCTLKPNQGSNTRSSAVGQNYTCFCFPIWSQFGELCLSKTFFNF